MATLLTMINDLRILLREEQITSISAADDLTQALIKLINRASQDVLESRTWSFDKRFDGTVNFPGLASGTLLITGTTTNTVRVESASAGSTMFINGDKIITFCVTNDTVHPGIIYQIVSTNSILVPTYLILTLTSDWIGEQGISVSDAIWEMFCTDVVLPSTVRKVLSVRDYEQSLQVSFSEREIFWDRVNPRTLDYTGDPISIAVGGTGTGSYNEALLSSGLTGTVMSVRPVPTSDVSLGYTYVYRHPSMSEEEDTLSGVPDRIINLIVDKAFYYCLAGNIEADYKRAQQMIKQYRIDLELAGREDRVTPNRRRIMRPVVSHPGRHPNSRWSDSEVPSP